MKQYIWYHPLYVAHTPDLILTGQQNNAKRHNYIVIEDTNLKEICANDHLTIVGHSTPPTLDIEEDTGFYIQGEDASQCIQRLIQSGLRFAPSILSLECCNAGKKEGIAYNFSIHPFLKNCIIEANPGGIGRNHGAVEWFGMTMDMFGRVVTQQIQNQWIFLFRGNTIAKRSHASYILANIFDEVSAPDFHEKFFAHYKPGLFNGRVGRYCSTGKKITFEKAMIFANEAPKSSTAKALDCFLK